MDHDTTSQTQVQQNPVKDEFSANDYHESAHDSNDTQDLEVTFQFKRSFSFIIYELFQCCLIITFLFRSNSQGQSSAMIISFNG